MKIRNSNRGREGVKLREVGGAWNLLLTDRRNRRGVFRYYIVPRTSHDHSLPLNILSADLGTDGTEDNVHLLQTTSLCLWNDQGEGTHRTDIDGGIHDEDLPPEVGDPRGGVVTDDEVYEVHVSITTPDGRKVDSTHSITTGKQRRQQGHNVLS